MFTHGDGLRASIEGGVLHVGGRPRFFLSTDYPYYRDSVANWRPRLVAQKEAGLDILTCYAPWRHHMMAPRAYDFSGRTQPNRDLVGLLSLAQELDLMVILKPGPFVHAELPFGGLPDAVCSECHPEEGIEPAVDSEGALVRWDIGRMRPRSRHLLPAPFGEVYLRLVRDWLGSLARDVMRDRMYPNGPIIAAQLMNEGIYSDSSNADPRHFAYSKSTLARYHEFLQQRYHGVQRYDKLHGTMIGSLDAIVPPRGPKSLSSTQDLLAYLDWSEFQGLFYIDAARLYRSFLVEGGVPDEAPIIFNFNPNGGTYRHTPASNDGWYTRVNLDGDERFTFGTTNWLGVVAADKEAYRQYVMLNTSKRGPSMEQNWGFATEYYTPYEFVTPSLFECLVALAAGSTGLTAYTFAGTRAWRDDANLRGEWMQERTSSREGPTSGDYPGDAPILSDGTKTPKYWALKQLAQYFGDEGPGFVKHGPLMPLAWAMYRPYAWAGQWLTRGDPDDLIWRPPLQAIPRGAFHGLDAFVEMLMSAGLGFRQFDIQDDSIDLSGTRLLCLSGHEYMDAATQEKLASFVESGGVLLLTTMVADRDNALQPFRGALAERLYPHRVIERRVLHAPGVVRCEDLPEGRAVEFANVVAPPSDAELLVTLDDSCVGYGRGVGEGRAVFLGFSPWRARLSGDDAAVAAANQAFVLALANRLSQVIAAQPRPLTSPEEVTVWSHVAEGEGRQLFVIVRETRGGVLVQLTDHTVLRVASPSQAVQSVLLQDGRPAACFLRGMNDLRGEAFAPSALVDGRGFQASAPCDLCVTRWGGGLRVSIAQTLSSPVRVILDLDREPTSIRDATGRDVPFVFEAGRLSFEANDIAKAGVYEVYLEPLPSFDDAGSWKALA